MLLPHPASCLRAPVRPCIEDPPGESIVLSAAVGACNHRARWSSGAEDLGAGVGLGHWNGTGDVL